MRVFFSLEFPEEIKRDLLEIQKEIDKLGLVKGKFTEFDNLHLTLKFLGEISASELRAVKDRIKTIKFKPFHAELSEIGIFSEKAIRIIWVSINAEEIFSLQKSIDESLADLFPKEYRFMAHITIARPKFTEDNKIFIDELKKIKFAKKKFLVDKLLLNESILTSYGAKYNKIDEINFSDEELMVVRKN